MNPTGTPRLVVTEVQAENIAEAVVAANSVTATSVDQIISARLKAPIIIE